MKSTNEAAARHVPSGWGKRGSAMRMGAARAETRRSSETRLQVAHVASEKKKPETDAERWADVPCTD